MYRTRVDWPLCRKWGYHSELLLQPESTHLAIVLNTLFKCSLSFSRELDLVHESESIEIVQYNIWRFFGVCCFWNKSIGINWYQELNIPNCMMMSKVHTYFSWKLDLPTALWKLGVQRFSVLRWGIATMHVNMEVCGNPLQDTHTQQDKGSCKSRTCVFLFSVCILWVRILWKGNLLLILCTCVHKFFLLLFSSPLSFVEPY